MFSDAGTGGVPGTGAGPPTRGADAVPPNVVTSRSAMPPLPAPAVGTGVNTGSPWVASPTAPSYSRIRSRARSAASRSSCSANSWSTRPVTSAATGALTQASWSGRTGTGGISRRRCSKESATWRAPAPTLRAVSPASTANWASGETPARIRSAAWPSHTAPLAWSAWSIRSVTRWNRSPRPRSHWSTESTSESVAGSRNQSTIRSWLIPFQ